MAYILIIFTTAYSASDPEVSPQQFWDTFRQAELSNNTNHLICKTYFPLELRGVNDSQPVTFFKQDQFKEIFDKVLNQSVVIMDGDDINMKKLKILLKQPKNYLMRICSQMIHFGWTNWCLS